VTRQVPAPATRTETADRMPRRVAGPAPRVIAQGGVACQDQETARRPRTGSLVPCLTAFAVCAWLGASAQMTAQAASFDCTRASTKLYRAICSDPDLSRLDEEVWNAYGERVKTLTPAQYAQVRDRHITWRRQRGRYERGIDALTAEYQRHLAWITHPLLPYEGRYERADGAELSVEIDAQSPGTAPAAIALGRSARLQWMPAPPGAAGSALVADAGAGTPQPAVPWRDNMLAFAPNFAGAPIAPVANCRFTLRWSGDIAQLASTGACGADFDGDYLLKPPPNPAPRMPEAARKAPPKPAPVQSPAATPLTKAAP